MKPKSNRSEVLAGSRPENLSGDLPVTQPGAAQAAAASTPSSADAAHQRDRLVVMCSLIVCVAFSTALHSHYGSTKLEAILAGIAIFSACLGLIGIQAQTRRHAELQSLKATVARLDGVPFAPAIASGAVTEETLAPVAAKSEPGMGSKGPIAPIAIEPNARWAAAATDVLSGVSPNQSANQKDAVSERAGQATTATAPSTRHAVIKQPVVGNATRPVTGQTTDATLWPGTTLNTADPMRDQWAFRPRDTVGAPSGQNPVESGKTSLTSAASGSATMDADLAIVQQKIKALAEEVNAAELAKQKLGSFEGALPQAKSSQVMAESAQQPVIHSPAASAIDDSIDALKAVAASMLRNPPNFAIEPAKAVSAPVSVAVTSKVASQDAMTQDAMTKVEAPLSVASQSSFGELFIPASAQPIAVSSPAFSSDPAVSSGRDFASIPEFEVPATAVPLASAPLAAAPLGLAQMAPAKPELALSIPAAKPASPARPARTGRAGEIASAVEAGRIDVMLSPIVDLQANNVTHYDLSFTVKTASGQNADSTETELVLNGSDLLALFDRARLVRAAGVASLLADKQKLGAVLSPINGRSMTNDSFLLEFARVFEEREGIATQLVLTFSQADVEQFSPQSWQSLSDMKAFGFRFALDQIDHLSADFKGLVRRGFAFAKMDAKALLSGMPSKERFLPADEACRVLAGAGLTIVADGLVDEKVRAQIFGFGVLYGQGQLFGAPRPVDVKVPAIVSRTAAA